MLIMVCCRLALSHNSLGDLPPRLSECSRLRYLNVRYNALKDIPRSVRFTSNRPQQ